MRVIGIGLNKTGTTSLGKALEILGFEDHFSWSLDNTKDWSEGNIDKLLLFADKYNNLEDWPWPLMYKEFDKRYSDVRFILTKRKNESVWYNSQCKHYIREYREETFFINKVIYGYENPQLYKNEYIEFYNNHNESVRNHFNGKKNFLEVCWENGDGWKELCSFLGKEIPKQKFPCLNQSPSKNILEKIYRKITR